MFEPPDQHGAAYQIEERTRSAENHAPLGPRPIGDEAPGDGAGAEQDSETRDEGARAQRQQWPAALAPRNGELAHAGESNWTPAISIFFPTMPITRRQFLAGSAGSAGLLLWLGRPRAAAAFFPRPALPPATARGQPPCA